MADDVGALGRSSFAHGDVVVTVEKPYDDRHYASRLLGRHTGHTWGVEIAMSRQARARGLARRLQPPGAGIVR
jgi:hypothetical protein